MPKTSQTRSSTVEDSALFDNPGLKLLHLRVIGQVQSPILWNSFPGSILHGALGFHLKRLSCVVPHGRCGECILNWDCTYGQLYEPRPPAETKRMRKYDRVPSALRLSIFPWYEPRLDAGAQLEIRLVLVNAAVNLAPLLLIALAEALAEGIGRKPRGGERGTVVLKQIVDGESSARVSWSDFNPTRQLPFEIPAWKALSYPASNPLRIQFETPVRVVAGGKVKAKPAFRDLMSSLMRRISSLAYFGAGMDIEADFKGMLERAAGLEVTGEFHRIPVHRYSSRQKSEMALDGVLGFMELPEESIAFIPWLAIGQRVGVGKNTGMGMGSYRLE